MIVVSIDPGTDTGLAEWDTARRAFRALFTWTILQTVRQIEGDITKGQRADLYLFEDARKMRIGGGRTFGKVNRLQGVGSVKRDCAIWEEFFESMAVPYVATPPIIGGTKMKAPAFNALTGWTGRTSSHARDAAVRALNLNDTMIRAMIAEWRQGYLMRKGGK
jgi:hypothetical protein